MNNQTLQEELARLIREQDSLLAQQVRVIFSVEVTPSSIESIASLIDAQDHARKCLIEALL